MQNELDILGEVLFGIDESLENPMNNDFRVDQITSLDELVAALGCFLDNTSTTPRTHGIQQTRDDVSVLLNNINDRIAQAKRAKAAHPVLMLAVPEILSLLAKGSKIEAIKALRVRYDYGLKESKDLIDGMLEAVDNSTTPRSRLLGRGRSSDSVTGIRINDEFIGKPFTP